MKEALSVFDISGSGLTAQRFRMGVIAANIAHANSTSTPSGEPYRRREAVFSTALAEALGDEEGGSSPAGANGTKLPGPWA